MTVEKQSSRDASIILEIEKETFEAIRKADAAALGRILADDFVYRTPFGQDVNKEAFIKAATTMPYKILSVRGENLRVSIYGEVAVLTGIQHAQVLDNEGKEQTSSVAFTDIFVKRGGRWLMTLAFGVELGAASATPPAPDKP